MAGIKISAMTPDSSVDGTELVPVSDAGSPKSVTVNNVKDYTIDQIEAIAAAVATTGSDSLYLLQGGALKPIDIDTVVAYALTTMWGKTAETAPDSADIITLLDGSTEKTVTLALLAEYVRATIEEAILDVSDLEDGSAAMVDGDYFLITRGTAPKRIQLSDLIAAVYAGLNTYVTSLSAVTSGAGADVLYVIQGGITKKITLTQIATFIGATITGSGTTDFLAQWASASTVKAGPEIVLSTTGFAPGDDSDLSLPTTMAVRTEMDKIIEDADDIAEALADTDSVLVINDSGETQSKSAISRLWTYVLAKIVAVADVSTWGFVLDQDTLSGDDATKLATQQSIKAYVDTEAAKVSNLDIDGDTDIGADLADADLIIVDDGATGTNRKSAVSRLWTYILAKIVAVTDVSTWGFVLDQDTLSGDDATKLATQQSIKAYVDDIAFAVKNSVEGGTAKLTLQTAHETHTLAAAATSSTTTISIPSGARLLGVSMNVDTAVADDGGDDTWSAAFETGSTTALAAAAAAAQNTKIDLQIPDEISTGVCQVKFTPNGGSFTAGVIEVVAYYWELTSLADA